MRRHAVVERNWQARLAPRVKVWVECDGQYAFGHGLGEILQAVDQTGSFKEATGVLGKSYRYIWGRIKEAEAILGVQLIASHVGGRDVKRSFLTAEAKALVKSFGAFRARLKRLTEREFARCFGDSRLDFQGLAMRSRARQ